jgi:hypothetical protein
MRKFEDKLKTYIKVTGCDHLYWIHLALVNTSGEIQ